MPTAIETNPLPDPRGRRLEQLSLLSLIAFTFFAVAGYAVFGLHPQLLQHAPGLASIYAPAFSFFAQGHVVLSGIVLLVMLTRRVGRRWMPAFVCVYAISLAAELLGTQTGFPFGGYAYTASLGLRWFGHVPLLIPLSWFCMAVPAYVLAAHLAPDRTWVRVIFAATLLTMWDLSLDPAMSYLTSYWIWQEHGIYYGMPLVNLVGWFGTGLLIAGTLHRLGVSTWVQADDMQSFAAYYVIVAAMPIGMLIAAGIWGAVVLTLGAITLCVLIMHWLRRGSSDSDRRDDHRRSPEEQLAVSSAETAALLSPVSVTGDALRESRHFVEQHSRSFALACRFLAPADRRVVESLYRFCRVTDDLVDLRSGEARERVEADLDRWIILSRVAYDGRPSGLDWLDGLMRHSREAGVPFSLVEELAAGVRTDLGSVAFQSERELDEYCYRVASVVGIWLCYLSGTNDPLVLRQAALMGRAMQLTNVLRDVGEDLARDRVYLPAELMGRYGVQRTDLEAMHAGAPVTPGYRNLLEHLMQDAGDSYASAWPGLAWLPIGPARSFAIAASVYEGILPAIRANGYRNLNRRAYTTRPRKLWLAAMALIRLYKLRGGIVFGKSARGQLTRLPRIVRRSAAVSLVALTMAPVPGVAPVAHARPEFARATDASMWFPTRSQRMRPPRFATRPADRSAAADDGIMTAGSMTTNWLEDIRSKYLLAVDDPSVIREVRSTLAQHLSRNSVADAYAAAFTVLEAKHALWPHRKLQFLRRGLAALDELVEANPEQVEIRYLRLLSCYFLPGLFGRSGSVEDDFSTLSRLLPDARGSFSREHFEQMVRFVLEAGAASPTERAALTAAIQ